jgi:hypothetical protein
VEPPALITGHRGNGAPGPDLTGPENQPTAARFGVAVITAGQTLIRTFGCNSCGTVNGSANTDLVVGIGLVIIGAVAIIPDAAGRT